MTNACVPTESFTDTRSLGDLPAKSPPGSIRISKTAVPITREAFRSRVGQGYQAPEVQQPRMPAQAFRGRIGQAGQSIEVQRKVMLAQALHR